MRCACSLAQSFMDLFENDGESFSMDSRGSCWKTYKFSWLNRIKHDWTPSVGEITLCIECIELFHPGFCLKSLKSLTLVVQQAGFMVIDGYSNTSIRTFHGSHVSILFIYLFMITSWLRQLCLHPLWIHGHCLRTFAHHLPNDSTLRKWDWAMI